MTLLCGLILAIALSNGNRDHDAEGNLDLDMKEMQDDKGMGHYFVNENRGEARGAAQCKAHVEDTLSEIKDKEHHQDSTDNVDARIGAVLGSQAFLADCCAEGTDFDEFLLQEVTAEETPAFDAQTALVIIDVQKDFTTGSFAQPCWAKGGNRFVEGIKNLMVEASKKQATIIVSKDLHPQDHCSFGKQGQCDNTKDQAEPTSGGSRYQNEFPAHCAFDTKASAVYATPLAAPQAPFCMMLAELGAPAPPFCDDPNFVGAAFEAEFANAMNALPPETKLEVVFKGFHQKYDSFSAMKHDQTKIGNLDVTEKIFTGGYALPKSRAGNCRGHWDEKADCYPSIAEMKISKSAAGEQLRSFDSILTENRINKLVVVGLVYDFCVKETAIFTRENAPEMDVTVLADLTRPSFDGKPGAPYTSGFCDGPPGSTGFCSEGGGTKPLYEKVLADYKANGVKVTRRKST